MPESTTEVCQRNRGMRWNGFKRGRLRLLCATSSMELGIDVGDVEQVLQVGCPRTISSTMQRLGRPGTSRAGSASCICPRTAPESVYCGMTAQVARRGGVERANPRACVWMYWPSIWFPWLRERATAVDDVMDVLERSYPFYQVTRKDVGGRPCHVGRRLRTQPGDTGASEDFV